MLSLNFIEIWNDTEGNACDDSFEASAKCLNSNGEKNYLLEYMILLKILTLPGRRQS